MLIKAFFAGLDMSFSFQQMFFCDLIPLLWSGGWGGHRLQQKVVFFADLDIPYHFQQIYICQIGPPKSGGVLLKISFLCR